MDNYINKQFGNYKLLRLLGEGAFAQVYLGEHIYLGTQAAIKILKTQTDEYPLDWFRTEARNIAHLVHPNIVRVLEFGVEDNTPFLVLDYASNGTLRQRHPNGTLVPLPTVVSYVKQMAEALQYAHDEKLIHRDVKPENMLLGRRNEVLLSDFGIALMAAQTIQSQRVQDVAGTLPYMAPEQIQGYPRPASDQYSLGIIAYEWLAGKRPYGGSLAEIVAQHLAASPFTLRGKMQHVSPAVELVVMTALEKEPTKRFGSVRAFAVALEQASKVGTSTTGQVDRSTVTTAPIAAVSSGNIPSSGRVTPTVYPVAPSPTSPFTRPLGPVGTVVSRYWGHLYDVRSLSWSPDSQRIISSSNEKTVHIWDALTGNEYKSYQDTSDSVRAVAWSPDGAHIATAGSDAQVWVWDVATNRLVSTYRGHTGSVINALAWSSSQPLLATAASDGTVHVWDTNSGQIRSIYRGHSGSVNMLAWSPNGPASSPGRGYHIVSGGDDASVQIWEAFTAKNVTSYSSQGAKITGIAWSPNVYSSSSGVSSASNIYSSSRVGCGRVDGLVQMWDTSSNREVLSYRYPAPIGVVAWSPDGRRFAYGCDDKKIEVWDTMTNLKLFTFSHTAPLRALSWSPDGKYIASGGGDMIQVWVAP